MRNNSKVAKILWALDPFANGDFGLDAGAHSAQSLAQMWNRPVEPVFVLSPESLEFPGDFTPDWAEEFIPQLEEKLREKVNAHASPQFQTQFLDPKILVCHENGKKKELQVLLNYARKNGPAPVVLTTHGRTGISRWMLGSFAETALLNARTPLLVVSPDHELSGVKVAFFPTNFSRVSRAFINKQIPWLKENNIRAVIYHKLNNSIDPFIQSGMTVAGGGWVSFQSMMQEESVRRQAQGEKLCADLIAKGVDAKFVMGASEDSLEHGVVEAAKAEHADLIGLVTEADTINANLVGSLARQLSRAAPCPLWIQHS